MIVEQKPMCVIGEDFSQNDLTNFNDPIVNFDVNSAPFTCDDENMFVT